MRIVKRTLNFSIVFALSFLFVCNVYAAREGMSPQKFSDQEQVYLYRSQDGSYLKNEWKQAWGNWYYFGAEGLSKQSTWAEIDGKWYYFDNLSIMLHDTTTPDGYQVGSDGAWIVETGMPVDTPVWIGTYIADDGQTITVKSADGNGINVVFNGYSEEGDYTQEYTLPFVDAAKKQAVYNEPQFDQRDIYTLTETGIEVKVEPSGGWKQGTYVKQ